jgi:16S rRNA (cytosine1402-N4)-methyltransferase
MTVNEPYRSVGLESSGGHIPVLKNEVISLFTPLFPGKFLDMTFGGGGHTTALLEGNKQNSVVGVDCDPAAVARAQKVTEVFGSRFSLVRGFFDEVDSSVEGTFDGILMDLGVSSFQFDTPERGFSFRADAQLDMRMNPTVGIPAWKLLETADEDTLVHIVRDLAEDRRWRIVVKKILSLRGTGRLQTTTSLCESLFGKTHFGRIHPATRLFMGLRIAVNDELGRLERALGWAWSRLETGGVLQVISFHSGEDRLVKNFVQSHTRPRESADGVALIKKILQPSETECQSNPRARSAKLRALAKLPLRNNFPPHDADK